MPYLKVNGTGLYYGAGQPVVLLHGRGTSIAGVARDILELADNRPLRSALGRPPARGQHVRA